MMSAQPNSSASAPVETSSTVSLAIAWLFVGIPLVWGVAQTFIKALTLFQ
ncbi:hypothetical protein HMJ29_06305 [Hymenobacter taeanensis]|uniref:Oxalate:formate antiporter n=1 Tax=Hymenobacter taeanensis TaxID=2735321 RepID=A0A6M6BC35_9BACT|nr:MULTISPECIES: hypothetical protein [Hymenobacter]QJX45398.1 hypothetical protein HMJ29_06305 [Hymenobacter taeanensis]UOQ80429.1 hypothetical protein MUN83_16620 [Hymenobacter sp. 5414T-23]